MPSERRVRAGVAEENVIHLCVQEIFSLVEETQKEPASAIKCSQCWGKVRAWGHSAGTTGCPGEGGDIFTEQNQLGGEGNPKK